MAVSDRERKILDRYADNWEELTVLNSLIVELEGRKQELKEKQRQLANALVKSRLTAED